MTGADHFSPFANSKTKGTAAVTVDLINFIKAAASPTFPTLNSIPVTLPDVCFEMAVPPWLSSENSEFFLPPGQKLIFNI